jgi:hypothetical protein
VVPVQELLLAERLTFDRLVRAIGRCPAQRAKLHARYWRLVERRKPTTVAATAVARELTGFCSALMRLPA